jgi:translation initiation factor IF-2
MGDGAGRSRSGAGAVEGRTKAGPGARVKARGKVKPKDRASGAARTMPRASEGAVPGVKIHQGAGSGTGTGERPLTGGKPEADKCPEVRPGTKARPGPKPGPSAKPGPKPGPSAKPRQKSKSGSKSGPETRLRARRKPVDCGEDLRTGVEGPETSGTVARDGVLSEASPRFLSSTDECQAEGSRPSRPPRQPRPPRPSRLSAGAAGEGNGDSPERNGPRGAPDLSMPASQEADAPCGTDTPDTHGRAGAVDPPEGGGQ